MAVEANRIATLAKDADTPRTVGPVLLIANVKSDGSTEVLRFVTDESIVDMVLEQLGKDGANDNASDPFARRVYESYMKFREASIALTDITERAYLNARALDFPYGN